MLARIVTLVAERGDLLLDAGVRVAGAGDIALRANDGAIRTTEAAAQWRTEGAGFDDDLDWALVNRRFDVNVATGEITAARLNVADTQIHGLSNGQVLREAGFADDDIVAFLRACGYRRVAELVQSDLELDDEPIVEALRAGASGYVLKSGADRLFTEDLQHGQNIDWMRVENPFL